MQDQVGTVTKKNLRKMFQKKGTLMIQEESENSELMKKLRKWKMDKKKLEQEKFDAQLEECEPDMNENEIKIMILKLITIEKYLKQIGTKKRKDASKKQKKQKKGGRDGGVSQVGGNRSALKNKLGASGQPRREDDNLSVSAMGDQSRGGRRNKKHRDSIQGLPDNSSAESGSVRGGGQSQMSVMSRPGLQIGHLSEHSGLTK